MAVFDIAKTLNIPELPGYLSRVQEQLELTVNPAGGSLKKPLLQTVRAKSKRLRPALVIASAQPAKVDDALVLGSCAIELLHLGSLVHDDVIDNAASRWGRPTINASLGPAAAILAGDYLLARAVLQAALVNAEAAALVSETIATLSLGESQETAGRFNLARAEEDYFECVSAKTGALIAAACRMGGVCAGLPAEQTKAFAAYGQKLGVSFQIIDDLLDLLSTSKLLGKPVHSDTAQGIYTLPVLLSLAGTRRAELKTLLNNPDAEALARLLINDGTVSQSVATAKKYNRRAVSSLRIFKPNTVSALAGLPDAYLKWSLTSLVAPSYSRAIANSL